MKKLLIKLGLSLVLNLLCIITVIYYIMYVKFSTSTASMVTMYIIVTLIMFTFLLLLLLLYKIKPFEKRKHKVIYWIISILPLAAHFYFWFFYPVPFWNNL